MQQSSVRAVHRRRATAVMPWTTNCLSLNVFTSESPAMDPVQHQSGFRRVVGNTAISFVTNTNWQSYTPETTMSNLTQTLGLAVQNFVSTAVGLSVAIAVVRGFVRVRTAVRSETSGSTWSAASYVSCFPVLSDRADPADRRRNSFRQHRFRLDGPRRVVRLESIGSRCVAGGDKGTGHQRWQNPRRELRAPIKREYTSNSLQHREKEDNCSGEAE